MCKIRCRIITSFIHTQPHTYGNGWDRLPFVLFLHLTPDYRTNKPPHTNVSSLQRRHHHRVHHHYRVQHYYHLFRFRLSRSSSNALHTAVFHLCAFTRPLSLSLSLSLLLVYVPLNALLTSREYNNRRRVGCWLLAFKLI